MHCLDHVRIDMKTDAAGVLRIMEVNGIPGLKPHKSWGPQLCTLYFRSPAARWTTTAGWSRRSSNPPGSVVNNPTRTKVQATSTDTKVIGDWYGLIQPKATLAKRILQSWNGK